MAIEAGILRVIGEKDGDSINAEALATITGYNTLLIERIMRLVTYAGYCNEIGENEYTANEVTHLANAPAMLGGIRHLYDLFLPIGAVLPQYLRETGVHQFPTKPEDRSPFFYGHNMQFWDFFETHPRDRADFDNLMEGRRKGLPEWYEMFPMASKLGPNTKRDPGAVLFVDVGGNKGHDAINFHHTHPEIPGRLILQDLPPMIERVRKDPPKDIELMTYDFFTPQPIKGARVYYFRNICHDWSDEQCQRILTNTVNSMERGYSTILIDDFVLPNTGAPLRGGAVDFLMMMYTSGIERSLKHWQKLLDACNLEIVKVWGLDPAYEQVIECQLKA
ncbi:hypothetical protein ACLMJK_005418 [Lecanora helva]